MLLLPAPVPPSALPMHSKPATIRITKQFYCKQSVSWILFVLVCTFVKVVNRKIVANNWTCTASKREKENVREKALKEQWWQQSEDKIKKIPMPYLAIWECKEVYSSWRQNCFISKSNHFQLLQCETMVEMKGVFLLSECFLFDWKFVVILLQSLINFNLFIWNRTARWKYAGIGVDIFQCYTHLINSILINEGVDAWTTGFLLENVDSVNVILTNSYSRV